MARLLKVRGAYGHARMLAADFDGRLKDGASFRLRGSADGIADGDLIAFFYPDGVGAGICVEEDDDGLCAHVRAAPSMSFRIGIDDLGDRVFAFRPAPQHLALIPQLRADGAGVLLPH
ncbi:hypothetical protein [Sphingomonas bacterium]|uniref:hypothetical protein n=1 Tax=Sphingomonas bacterium TaxID=1895847 RepID=UPI0026174E1E|nr:hypothetical protein [Sphingomonas bacterium]